MNVCVLYGRISSAMEYKFVYNHKKYLSMIQFMLETEKKVQVLVRAYNELADLLYQNYEENDFLFCCGRVEGQIVKIDEIY